jgi:hypothetical protein
LGMRKRALVSTAGTRPAEMVGAGAWSHVEQEVRSGLCHPCQTLNSGLLTPHPMYTDLQHRCFHPSAQLMLTEWPVHKNVPVPASEEKKRMGRRKENDILINLFKLGIPGWRLEGGSRKHAS